MSYKNGKIELFNMDCMEYMRTVPDKYFDLAIVDPPYGIDVTKMNMGGRKTVKKDLTKSWDSGVPDDAYFLELFRISKAQVIWGGITLLCLAVSILQFGTKARQCTGATLPSASMHG